MSRFRARLDAANPRRHHGALWVFVPMDQLTTAFGPLASDAPRNVILLEAGEFLRRRPYHRQKIALLLANQRHFALELAAAGHHVVYRQGEGTIVELLGAVLDEAGAAAVMMEPAERELRAELAPLCRDGRLDVVPHGGWLTTRRDFEEGTGGPPWRMDAFYRHVRRRTGILMEDGKPVGGRFSLDGENREPWRGNPPAPTPPVMGPDEIREEVGAEVARVYTAHPGAVDLANLPATRAEAVAMLHWAMAECMESFGTYEDAMSTASSGLFHTRLSPLINIHRLTPREVLDAALATEMPLNSREGFVRQLIGWREYVKHVHDATDGFRRLPGGTSLVAGQPGDGGFAQWAGEPWQSPPPPSGIDGGAMPDHLATGNRPLPPAWWGRRSGLACLDHVVDGVWREGWSHHITRLMVLANIAALLDVSPRALTDWFWVAYTDAWDWVVEPNVLGMGTFAVGEVMTTKPYVAGAAYIHRMGNFCGDCAFDPNGNCPLRRLYWAYLARHESALRANPRVGTVVRSLGRRTPADRARDAALFDTVSSQLTAGRRLTPESLADEL
jgi:deoxyribodipyrimidine photolyase-related protein